jgi:hypothetical protein
MSDVRSIALHLYVACPLTPTKDVAKIGTTNLTLSVDLEKEMTRRGIGEKTLRTKV